MRSGVRESRSWLATASAGDYELPRPTNLTVTNALVECLEERGCEYSVACTRDGGARFEDHDFADTVGMDQGEAAWTARKWQWRERCVLRVEGAANVSGFRYMKLRQPSDDLHYAGVAEIPLHRANSVADVVLPEPVMPETHPFYVVLAEARVMSDAPPVDLHAMEGLVKSALGRMGLAEYEDYLVLHVDNAIDVSDVAEDMKRDGVSGVVTWRFKKVIQERLTYDVAPAGHGLVYIGGVSAWPTGRDHGSYNYAGQDSQFRSFCYSTGFITCSADKEDCLGHELGHAFGMYHEYNDWYGFDPTDEHIERIRAQIQCAADYGPNWTGRPWTPDDLANL